MRNLFFDIRGNLQPSEIMLLSWEHFYKIFVLDFEDSETRKKSFVALKIDKTWKI
jgi:hypothetical protein